MPALSMEMRRIREECRVSMLEYTRQAFARLSGLPRSPRILDLGCGSGPVSRELARLSGGVVTGIDTDQVELGRFVSRARRAGLDHRVHAVCMDFLEPPFRGPGFDLLWAEGVTRFVSPAEALQKWAPLAAPGGILVMHEERSRMQADAGGDDTGPWRRCGGMPLPPDAWWRQYYRPLWTKLRQLESRGVSFPRAERAALCREIAILRRDPDRCATAFYFFRRVALGRS